MQTVRPPAVAGLFYPADARELAASVQHCLTPVPGMVTPKALVVPHAGYPYSGPIAGAAYACLPDTPAITRVVLLGPSHRVALDAMALPTVDAFRTPLGDIPIDPALRRTAAALPDVILHDLPHQQEHALEVQLPFLQTVLGAFTLLPVVVGDVGPDRVARLLEAVWGGPETLVVVSTDLSHYLPYASAQATDAATSGRILARDTGITPQQACGARPLNGLLRVAQHKGLAVQCVQLANSGDTAGDHSRVVGYGAYVLH